MNHWIIYPLSQIDTETPRLEFCRLGIASLNFFYPFLSTLSMCSLCRFMNKEWHNLSDADATLLEDAIIQSEEFAEKLAIFRSGLIPPEQRWLQLNAHESYDKLSMRELEVFKMRTLKHTFPVIAEALDISVSSAKTYWRRCLAKCTKSFMSTNESISDG